MAAVHEEYGRFLQWLQDAQASQDAKRIAKIAHAHLDAIIPTVHNGGQTNVPKYSGHLDPAIRSMVSSEQRHEGSSLLIEDASKKAMPRDHDSWSDDFWYKLFSRHRKARLIVESDKDHGNEWQRSK